MQFKKAKCLQDVEEYVLNTSDSHMNEYVGTDGWVLAGFLPYTLINNWCTLGKGDDPPASLPHSWL